MADTATIRTRIDEIDAIMASGVSNTRTIDDSVTWDLEALTNERARLMRVLSSSSSSQYRRVVFKNA